MAAPATHKLECMPIIEWQVPESKKIIRFIRGEKTRKFELWGEQNRPLQTIEINGIFNRDIKSLGVCLQTWIKENRSIKMFAKITTETKFFTYFVFTDLERNRLSLETEEFTFDQCDTRVYHEEPKNFDKHSWCKIDAKNGEQWERKHEKSEVGLIRIYLDTQDHTRKETVEFALRASKMNTKECWRILHVYNQHIVSPDDESNVKRLRLLDIHTCEFTDNVVLSVPPNLQTDTERAEKMKDFMNQLDRDNLAVYYRTELSKNHTEITWGQLDIPHRGFMPTERNLQTTLSKTIAKYVVDHCLTLHDQNEITHVAKYADSIVVEKNVICHTVNAADSMGRGSLKIPSIIIRFTPSFWKKFKDFFKNWIPAITESQIEKESKLYGTPISQNILSSVLNPQSHALNNEPRSSNKVLIEELDRAYERNIEVKIVISACRTHGFVEMGDQRHPLGYRFRKWVSGQVSPSNRDEDEQKTTYRSHIPPPIQNLRRPEAIDQCEFRTPNTSGVSSFTDSPIISSPRSAGSQSPFLARFKED